MRDKKGKLKEQGKSFLAKVSKFNKFDAKCFVKQAL